MFLDVVTISALADAIMDVCLSTLYLDSAGSIPNVYLSTAVGGIIDAGVDIEQTELYFSPNSKSGYRRPYEFEERFIIYGNKF